MIRGSSVASSRVLNAVWIQTRGKKRVPKFDDRQYLLNFIDDNGPMPADQLWEKLKDSELPKYGKIDSKSKMKALLQHLSDRNLIRARPSLEDKTLPFKYHVIRNFYKRREPPSEDTNDSASLRDEEVTSAPLA